MRNRRSSEIMRCLSQALGSAPSFVTSDALATPVPTACGDLLFLNSKKRKQKMPLSCARGGLCTAQSALRVAHHALACEVGGKREVGVRDGLARCARWVYRRVFWDGLFAMAFLNA